MALRIAETFVSIQGEGSLAGTPSVFLRVSGCNLRCSWCDTPYASWRPEGPQRTWESLRDEALAHNDVRHVVVTGGEPMLFDDVVPLCASLRSAGRHVTIETAGTYVPKAGLPECDLMSVSPKRANSTPEGAYADRHEERRHVPDVIEWLVADRPYQFKFVIDERADVDDVAEYLAEFPEIDPARVFLMPQATDADTLATKSDWLAPLAAARGWQLSPRLHVERWGNQRGV